MEGCLLCVYVLYYTQSFTLALVPQVLPSNQRWDKIVPTHLTSSSMPETGAVGSVGAQDHFCLSYFKPLSHVTITCLTLFFLLEAAYLSCTGILWQPNYILKKFPMKEYQHFQLTTSGHVKYHRAANLCCVSCHWVRGTGMIYTGSRQTGDSEVTERATRDLWDRSCPVYDFFVTPLPDTPPLALHRAKFPMIFLICW